MATEVIHSVKASGGDYSSLSAWEAAQQRDLVTVDEIAVAECYNDFGPSGLSDRVVVSGWTTSSTNKVIIRAATGHEHNGIRGSGFVITNGDIWQKTVSTGSSNVDVIGIESIHTATGSAFYCAQASWTNRFINCIGDSNGGSGAAGFYLKRATAINCLAIDCNNTGFGNDLSWFSFELINCIAVNCGTGIKNGGGGSTTNINETPQVRNSVAYNNSTNFSGNFFTGSANNAASDGSTTTPPGANSLTVDIVSTDFVNAANDDYHLTSGSQLKGAGADLSGSFTTDVDGDTRTVPWDIGFDAFVAVGGGALAAEDAESTPSAENTALSQAHQLSGANADATLSADTDAVTQVHTPVGDDAESTQAADGGGITQTHTLLAEEAVATSATDNGAVTQVHALVGENATNASLADNASITQGHTLTGADSESTPIADDGSVSTIGSHALVAEDAATTPSIDLIQIDQTQALLAEQSIATPTTDSGVVTQVHTLTAADAELTPVADSAAISSTATHILTAEDSNATPVIDVVNINQQHGLLSSDPVQTPEVDVATIDQTHALTGADAQATPIADAASLTGSGLGPIKSPSIRRLIPTYQLKLTPNQRSIKTIAA